MNSISKHWMRNDGDNCKCPPRSALTAWACFLVLRRGRGRFLCFSELVLVAERS